MDHAGDEDLPAELVSPYGCSLEQKTKACSSQQQQGRSDGRRGEQEPQEQTGVSGEPGGKNHRMRWKRAKERRQYRRRQERIPLTQPEVASVRGTRLSGLRLLPLPPDLRWSWASCFRAATAPVAPPTLLSLALGVGQDPVQPLQHLREEHQGLAAAVHRLRQAFGGGRHFAAEGLHVSGNQLHRGPQLVQAGLSAEPHALWLPGTRGGGVRSTRRRRRGRQTAPSYAAAARNAGTRWRRPTLDLVSTVQLVTDDVSKKKNICKNARKRHERKIKAAFLTNQSRARHQRYGPLHALIPDQVGTKNSAPTDRTFANWLTAG